MNYLKRRIREPSTWAGLAAIAGALLPPLGVAAATVSTVVATLGGVAIFVNEQSQP